MFQGEDYKVLCSSAARRKAGSGRGNAQGGALTGAGYFSGALVNGISPKGSYGADINDDGAVTLAELTAYLLGKPRRLHPPGLPGRG